MAELKFKITQSIACLFQKNSGWTKELNKVSCNGNPAKCDIGSWSIDRKKIRRGITVTNDELRQLKSVLEELL